MGIVGGEGYEGENIVCRGLVNGGNGGVMEMEMKDIVRVEEKIEVLNDEVDDYLVG